jgi:hypothetical protein
VLLFAMEAMICVVMGLPVFFVLSSLGGALICWLTNWREGRDSRDVLGIVLLLPLVFSPLEALWQPPTVVRETKRSVVVEAPAEVIWQEFVTVPKIQRSEERFAWFRAAGLPHPVEATLVNPGAEGIRYASYDNGMKVIEPVQVWELHERYRFGVLLDPESGHLQVQWVEYEIEKLSEHAVRLHLTSRYALETPINPYAEAWVNFLLSDFQDYILNIVTARAERRA